MIVKFDSYKKFDSIFQMEQNYISSILIKAKNYLIKGSLADCCKIYNKKKVSKNENFCVQKLKSYFIQKSFSISKLMYHLRLQDIVSVYHTINN